MVSVVREARERQQGEKALAFGLDRSTNRGLASRLPDCEIRTPH